jgi:hypothetical protein
MGKRIIKLGEETDWWFTNNRNLYAVNRDTRMFENTSYTQGMVMELYRDEDENDVANALGARLRDCREYEFVIYDASHRLVGFVYYPEEDEQGKKEPKKRVFRFHAHTWADVIVNENELDLEGLTEEQVDAEFAMKAEDKYNEGDYADDPSNFENTDMEEITDYLKDNKIYPFNE